MAGIERAGAKPSWEQRREANQTLDEARAELPGIRKGFIDATLFLIAAELSSSPSLYRPWYFSVFNSLLKEQKKIAVDKVLVPKVVLGEPIYHRGIEDKAKREGGNYAEEKGLPRSFGINVVIGHIRITKAIQRKTAEELREWGKALEEQRRTREKKPKKGPKAA